MRQSFHELTISTRGRGLYEFTDEISAWIARNHFQNGLLTLHLRHTSASLLIQENADPDVRRDLDAFFERLVPDGDPLFVHTAVSPSATGAWCSARGRASTSGNTALRRTRAGSPPTLSANKQ
jgi:secondary thiamine-phosphate synthase enzyme